jgi:hypothetical protein
VSRVRTSCQITYSSLSPSLRISPGHAVTPFTLVTPDSSACFYNQLKYRPRLPTHIVFNRPIPKLGTDHLEQLPTNPPDSQIQDPGFAGKIYLCLTKVLYAHQYGFLYLNFGFSPLAYLGVSVDLPDSSSLVSANFCSISSAPTGADMLDGPASVLIFDKIWYLNSKFQNSR